MQEKLVKLVVALTDAPLLSIKRASAPTKIFMKQLIELQRKVLESRDYTGGLCVYIRVLVNVSKHGRSADERHKERDVRKQK